MSPNPPVDAFAEWMGTLVDVVAAHEPVRPHMLMLLVEKQDPVTHEWNWWFVLEEAVGQGSVGYDERGYVVLT